MQGASTLDVAITGAAGVYGSTITGYKITVGSQTVNTVSGTTGPITASGTINVVGTVTDSRGRTASYTHTITVLSYAPPVLTAVSVERALSSGAPDDDGTYIRGNINAAVQSLKPSSTEKNALTYKISTRLHGATTWTLKTTVAPGGITFDSYDTVQTYDIDQSYDVLIQVSDLLATSQIALTISTSAVFMHWDGSDGVGIGKYRTDGMLDVAGDIYTDADIHAAGDAYVTGAIEAADVASTNKMTQDGRTVLDSADAIWGTDAIYHGVIDAGWSSGLAPVLLSTGVTVNAQVPQYGADIQPGAKVGVMKSGADWLIVQAYTTQPKYMRQIAIQPQNGWMLYSDGGLAKDAQQNYGDGASPGEAYLAGSSALAGFMYVTKTQTGVVHLEGMVRRNSVPTWPTSSTPSANAVIGILPVGFRPARSQLYRLYTASGGCDLEITPLGEIIALNGSSVDWIGLGNVRFRAAGYGTFVPLTATGFASDSTSFSGTAYTRTPGYTVDDEGVMLCEGAFKTTSAYTGNATVLQFTGLPAMLTTHQLVFCNYGTNGARYGAASGAAGSGNYLNFIAGIATGYVISLAQIVMCLPGYPRSMLLHRAQFQGGFTQYSTTYSTPGFHKSADGVVYAAGLYGNGTTGNGITWVPRGWEPRYKAMFATLATGQIAALVVQADGGTQLNNLQLVTQAGTSGWWTLDGFSWPTYRAQLSREY